MVRVKEGRLATVVWENARSTHTLKSTLQKKNTAVPIYDTHMQPPRPSPTRQPHLLLVHIAAHVAGLDAHRQQPVVAEVHPCVMHLLGGLGGAEVLQLPLVKLPGTEHKVAGPDLVPEALARLCNTCVRARGRGLWVEGGLVGGLNQHLL